MTTATNPPQARLAVLDRAVLEAAGPQRQKLLQGLLTNEVAGLGPGQGCLAALLSVKGGVKALVRVLVDDAVVVLEANADRVEMLHATLEHYRVAAPVRFARPATAVLALVGPGADEVARAAGAEAPALVAESHVRTILAGQGVRIVRASDLPGGGLVIHAAADSAAAVREALVAAGAPPLADTEVAALRVEALRPWYGADITEENLLHETGLVAECHSPTKGCYLGQEVDRAPRGEGRQREQGVARAAPLRAGFGRRRGHARGTRGRPRHDRGRLAEPRADRHGVRPPQRVRAGHRRRGRGRAGDGRDPVRGVSA